MPTSAHDPFKPANATVLRPKPGAGKRTPSMPPRTTAIPGLALSAPRAQPSPEPRISVPALPRLGGQGLNPLVTAATPLLLMAGGMRGSAIQGDIPALRRQALDEIRRFEECAKAAGVANEVVIAGRYALCAALDEAVLATPWGAHSDWARQTLLNALHREAYGGEKFFDMLERISQEPALRIDLIELQYLCVALGFNGKFQLLEHGQARLEDTQHETFLRIRSVRSAPEPALSIHWKGVEDRRNRLISYLPWWVVVVAVITVVTGAFFVFMYRLDSQADPIYAQLAKIGTESFATPPVQARRVPSGPTLRQLLAAEEAGGQLTLEENGPRTLITLVAPELFAPGSAALDPRYRAVLHAIGAAVDQVPGRVLVEGHTDDQPLRSFAFRDNYELSRERAATVVKILRADLHNAARLEIVGKGSSEPRYRPESTVENRARNRRVEIVHVHE